jgi:hypothetical protein
MITDMFIGRTLYIRTTAMLIVASNFQSLDIDVS